MSMHRETTRRRSGRSNELYNARKPRRVRSWACCVLIAVIFAGSLLQIGMLAQLMHQNKQIHNAGVQLQQLRNQVHNAKNALAQYTSAHEIRNRAEKLGMIELTTEEIRRVNVTLTADNSDTNAQTAYSGGNQ